MANSWNPSLTPTGAYWGLYYYFVGVASPLTSMNAHEAKYLALFTVPADTVKGRARTVNSYDSADELDPVTNVGYTRQLIDWTTLANPARLTTRTRELWNASPIIFTVPGGGAWDDVKSIGIVSRLTVGDALTRVYWIADVDESMPAGHTLTIDTGGLVLDADKFLLAGVHPTWGKFAAGKILDYLCRGNSGRWTADANDYILPGFDFYRVGLTERTIGIHLMTNTSAPGYREDSPVAKAPSPYDWYHAGADLDTELNTAWYPRNSVLEDGVGPQEVTGWVIEDAIGQNPAQAKNTAAITFPVNTGVAANITHLGVVQHYHDNPIQSCDHTYQYAIAVLRIPLLFGGLGWSYEAGSQMVIPAGGLKIGFR